MKRLEKLLEEVDGKSYPAYKSLKGTYQFGEYQLNIDHVQGDPFASPSRISILIPGKRAGFPKESYDTKWKKTALEDFLLRQFSKSLRGGNSNRGERGNQRAGSGKSGLLSISRYGQEVLERSACHINGADGDVLFRLAAGFPADGRRIRARELRRMLFEVLPKSVEEAGIYGNLRGNEVQAVIQLSEDQQVIREELRKRGLVAFVANGAILPRESGVSERPMKGAVPFQSPESMEVTMELPNKGNICGMGIPRGVTLIVGGGYHGKSTLLKALEKGVYPHIAGDGREYVVTESSATKIRAEDGRSISGTDISLFIHDLPNGKNTEQFTTSDASGSTSQAANVVEAMEAGAATLLMDEDTSATNFMIRDELMAQVVLEGQEPIIPFIRRVQDLYDQAGISTVLVAGSCGAFFHVADHIIQMECYKPYDITEKARKMAENFLQDKPKAAPWKQPVYGRVLQAQSSGGVQSFGGRKSSDGRQADGRGRKIKLMGKDGFSMDHQNVDLRYLEQITDEEQLMAIAKMLDYLEREAFKKNRPMPQLVEECLEEVKEKGFETVTQGKVLCDMAMPRKQEICGCINRYLKS